MKSTKTIVETHKNDYGCVMLYFDFPQIEKIHTIIKPYDLYIDPDDVDGFGLETEPHVTLLYGLNNDVSSENVKSVLKKIAFGTCQLNNISTFENEKYDLLKYDIDGDGLHEANIQLKRYPYTSEFPEYHPHLTIAYLKTKRGKKYTDALKGTSFTLTPKYAVYSKTDGSKEQMTILKK